AVGEDDRSIVLDDEVSELREPAPPDLDAELRGPSIQDVARGDVGEVLGVGHPKPSPRANSRHLEQGRHRSVRIYLADLRVVGVEDVEDAVGANPKTVRVIQSTYRRRAGIVAVVAGQADSGDRGDRAVGRDAADRVRLLVGDVEVTLLI